MKAYKIVKVDSDGTYKSCLGFTDLKCCVEYKVGEPVYPKIGKLFVFKKKADAIRFSKSFWNLNKSFKLFSCLATEAKKQTEISYVVSDNCVKSFWDFTLPDYDIDEAPKGTYCCSSVTLVKERKL